jgi:hypothetical protein
MLEACETAVRATEKDTCFTEQAGHVYMASIIHMKVSRIVLSTKYLRIINGLNLGGLSLLLTPEWVEEQLREDKQHTSVVAGGLDVFGLGKYGRTGSSCFMGGKCRA